jgi:integrase
VAETIDFTITNIDALRAPIEGRLEFKDSKVAGLYLRVTAGGIKSFSFVGRAKGSSRVERVTFGKYPIVKPDEARRKARVMAGELAGGTSAADVARERRGEMTLGELFKEYRASVVSKGQSTATLDVIWRLYIEPPFGARRLSEVKATDLERWHRALPAQVLRRREQIAADKRAKREAFQAERAASRAARRRGPDPKPKVAEPKLSSVVVTGNRTANMALQRVCAMYSWASEARRALFVGLNPASKHDLFPENQRERFLQPHELAPFFQALADEPSDTMRDFILLALLTGARRANVASMSWQHLDLERAEWRVPGELMKNGLPQTITLTPEAVEILTARHNGASSSFVFASDLSESGHIEDPRKAWHRVMRKANLSDLRVHDLRRTLGSWQARTGASLVLIGKSLNHKDQASTSIYARLDLDPVRQSVDRAMSAMFEAAGVKQKAKVLVLPNSRSSAQRSAGKTTGTKAKR